MIGNFVAIVFANDVRFALKSRHSAGKLRCPLRANCRLMHRNKKSRNFSLFKEALFSKPSAGCYPTHNSALEHFLLRNCRHQIRPLLLPPHSHSMATCIATGCRKPAVKPHQKKVGSILRQGEDQAWRCDTAERMRSKRDQRHLRLGGKRAGHKDRLAQRFAQPLQPADQIDGRADGGEI
jgi:YD repeat-containing protein